MADLEMRVAGLGERRVSLGEEQKAELMALAEEVWALWDHPDAPLPLKKRILRTVLAKLSQDG
jgi:hypothetical protein